MPVLYSCGSGYSSGRLSDLIGVKMPNKCNDAEHSRAHEHEVSLGVAIVGDKAKFRLHVGDAPAFEILGDNEAKQGAADTIVTEPGRFRF
jgi:hypothetical protein